MILFFSELINDLALSLIYSSIHAGRTTVTLLHHGSSNTIVHSPHQRQATQASWYAKHTPVGSLTHSFIPSSSCATLLFLCATASPCPVPLSLSFCPPAFLGHWAPPIFIHTMPCFVFMLAQWGDGVIDGGMILCFNNNRRGRSRRQHPWELISH